jgi:hypothetical protein
MRKTLYTLAIGDYPKEVTDLTFPWLKRYAYKCGADFQVITERKFPKWGITYEKHQIFKLGAKNDWNIFVDADALIHPDLFDITAICSRNHVCFTGQDMSAMRFKPDKYFQRDGRYIGACSWFVVSSDLTHDLWKPLDDLDPEEAYQQIFPTRMEQISVGITPAKLIEDYSLSRNIARYGLKHTTIEGPGGLKEKFGRQNDAYYWHQYTIGIDEKVLQMNQVIKAWGLEDK